MTMHPNSTLLSPSLGGQHPEAVASFHVSGYNWDSDAVSRLGRAKQYQCKSEWMYFELDKFLCMYLSVLGALCIFSLASRQPVQWSFFQNSRIIVSGYFDPINIFFDLKKWNNFRGDLSDISAKTASLNQCHYRFGALRLSIQLRLMWTFIGCRILKTNTHLY